MLEFRTDDGRALPSKKEAGVLSSGFDEGSVKVVTSAKQDQAWVPPEAPMAMPDYSQIEHLKKYFGKKPYEPYPAWIFHKNGESKIVNNHEEASAHGVIYREATDEEKGRFGLTAVWDWREDSDWRPKPWGAHLDAKGKLIRDIESDSGTKNLVHERIDPMKANHSLVRELLPQLASMLGGAVAGKNDAPQGFTADEIEEFRRFQAFKKAQESGTSNETGNALASRDASERASWEAEAERVGVQVDRRWSLETLKRKVEEAQS